MEAYKLQDAMESSQIRLYEQKPINTRSMGDSQETSYDESNGQLLNASNEVELLKKKRKNRRGGQKAKGKKSPSNLKESANEARRSSSGAGKASLES